jgi:hypothetical protein
MKWQEDIIMSYAFVPIVSERDYFKSESALAAWEYARSISKPFLIIVKNGVKVPYEFIEGLSEWEIATYDNIVEITGIILDYERRAEEKEGTLEEVKEDSNKEIPFDL